MGSIKGTASQGDLNFSDTAEDTSPKTIEARLQGLKEVEIADQSRDADRDNQSKAHSTTNKNESKDSDSKPSEKMPPICKNTEGRKAICKQQVEEGISSSSLNSLPNSFRKFDATSPSHSPKIRKQVAATDSCKAPAKTEPEINDFPRYQRVDQVWDNAQFRFKIQESFKGKDDSQSGGFTFIVRRVFDTGGNHQQTTVDIGSKILRECLQGIVGMGKRAVLAEGIQRFDPNMLFLYLEEFRDHIKWLKTLDPANDSPEESEQHNRRVDAKRSHLELLVKYLDEDYAEAKESLGPLLSKGLITFDLLWALWKPNTIAYSSTYGYQEEPRALKVEGANRMTNVVNGEFYRIQAKYIEFDGKKFGYGEASEDITHFQGARKITSLPLYPLKYHTDLRRIKSHLIERGKKFVALNGTHFKAFTGMAFMKRKQKMARFSIQQSRVMVDAATFRHINPNYEVSSTYPKDDDISPHDECPEDETTNSNNLIDLDVSNSAIGVRRITKAIMTVEDKGWHRLVHVVEDEAQPPKANRPLDYPSANDEINGLEGPMAASDQRGEDANKAVTTNFKDEDYLIASPVVLGFSFAEKQWFEFSVSGIKEIKWDDDAWDSLVLEPETKDLIHALVIGRKFKAAQTINDVIQGKGKGLVTVLHGPPGTGKTLTVEGISELLRCPLYAVSAGELGADARSLETKLQQILDICHTWGAILLLDEADVFMEKRDMHEIHRNSLVSVFLRELEYFQGILFLTTNRVQTFDEAFQSRIQVALKYEHLDAKAKKAIFQMFIERVRTLGKLKLDTFTDKNFDELARKNLNGREIKNIVGSAQDLAIYRKEALGMKHIRKVIEVHDKFGRDLRGGSGYDEAMRSYV